MSDSSSSGNGIGFGGALILLFIGLKLTNYIDWSWWWVLSPIWIVVALILLVFLCGGFIVVIVAVWKTFKQQRKLKNKYKKGVE